MQTCLQRTTLPWHHIPPTCICIHWELVAGTSSEHDLIWVGRRAMRFIAIRRCFNLHDGPGTWHPVNDTTMCTDARHKCVVEIGRTLKSNWLVTSRAIKLFNDVRIADMYLGFVRATGKSDIPTKRHALYAATCCRQTINSYQTIRPR